MELGGQVHVLAALLVGKQPSFLIEKETGWKKTLGTCQESKEDFPDLQPAA
jgi:hypothetical protein